MNRMIEKLEQWRKNTWIDSVEKFQPWMVDKLVLHTACNADHALDGCGPTILSLLTGVDPKLIGFQVGVKDCPPDKFFGFLTKFGFRYEKASIDNIKTHGKYIEEPFDKRHVLVFQQRLTKKEMSWQLSYNNLIWHGFDVKPLGIREFVNNPIHGMWIIDHPSWHYAEAKLPKEKRQAIDTLLQGVAETQIAEQALRQSRGTEARRNHDGVVRSRSSSRRAS